MAAKKQKKQENDKRAELEMQQKELELARGQVDYWLRRMRQQIQLDASELLKAIDGYIAIRNQMPDVQACQNLPVEVIRTFPLGSDEYTIYRMRCFLDDISFRTIIATLISAIMDLEANANKKQPAKKQKRKED